jgi:hypothetical protein
MVCKGQPFLNWLYKQPCRQDIDYELAEFHVRNTANKHDLYRAFV